MELRNLYAMLQIVGYSWRLDNLEDHTLICNIILLSTKTWVLYPLICHLCCVGNTLDENVQHCEPYKLQVYDECRNYNDPFFIIARGMLQRMLLSVAGIIQGDMCDEIGVLQFITTKLRRGCLGSESPVLILPNSTIVACSGIIAGC